MLPVSMRRRSLLLASAAAFLSVPAAARTSSRAPLPPVTVDAPQQKRTTAARPAQPAATRAARVQRVAPASTPPVGRTEPTGNSLETPPGGSLTVPATAQARALIERTPGGVALVPDTAFKSGPANTIKDVLGWVPGVIAQTRWGPDGRVSIRGSGLTRNYGNRGINVFTDGIPINTADGLFDLFEIDPTAYRYVEVYKGANALRFGANSLGGAINFVTPTGYDAGVRSARRCRQLRLPGAGARPVRTDRSTTSSTHRRNARTDIASTTGAMERLNANFGYHLLAGCRDPLLPERQHVARAIAGRGDQGRRAE